MKFYQGPGSLATVCLPYESYNFVCIRFEPGLVASQVPFSPGMACVDVVKLFVAG